MKGFGTWAQNAKSIKGFANLLCIRAWLASVRTTATKTMQPAQPGPDAETLQFEIFPQGFWPRSAGAANGSQGSQSTAPFLIRARISYLESLKPDRRIAGLHFGKRSDNGWIAFVFNGRAVVENAYYGNASYLFKADQDDCWIGSLQHSKYEVWKRQAGSGFVRRQIHRQDWEDRIMDFLTRP